ncbi:MAG: hypothetical protein CMN25_00725 [Salinicola sp.]|uniref:DUF2786 domain-containing protein n=1 Tax=uncultured Salinicola sp. TaxID=1193542 RepID=UPI000C95A801|nr:DUF2786 domain-containing protein [uncultured Salinicola sp.]MAM55847.1 hypothetical protein [Salinicola sp.]
MTSDRILRKIERCLALSRSANEHEAGIALRQAQRLMVDHGINELDVAASTIGRATTQAAAGRKPPKWLDRLAALVNAAFGTLAVYEARPTFTGWEGFYAFLGEQSHARIAAYAFEVLQRQLVTDRRAFLSGMSKRAKRITKIRRSDAFASAWVLGAYEHIVPVEIATDTVTAIDHYKQRYYTTLKEMNAIDRGQQAADHKAMSRGFEAGRRARLHSSVAQDERRALSHG